MKRILSIALALCMLLALCACGQANDPAPADTGDAAVSDTPNTEEAVKVAVIVKSTDSESWQYMLTGARNAVLDSEGKIEITEHGAASEADIAGQVTLLEDVIVSKPDAIVITPSDSDAVVAALEEAHEAGIKIIVVDTAVNTGEMMAEQMVKYLQEAGKELKGTIGIVSAVPVQTVYDRDDGFIDKMAELAPDITIISEQYVDNDMQKAMDLTNDYISAHADLIGVYGDNNVTGSGIALAIAEAGLEDEIVGVAYDGNPEEIDGIRNGALKAILVQDLYNWGYKAVNFAYDAVMGESIDSYYNTGVTLVTLENIDDESIQDVLDPSRLAR